jgi:hypothetical protein
VEQQLCIAIARLVDIGILEEDYISVWDCPTFVIPKNMEQQELVLISGNSCIIITPPIFNTNDWGHDLFHDGICL